MGLPNLLSPSGIYSVAKQSICRKGKSQRPRQTQTDKKPQWLCDKKKRQGGIDLTEERDAPPQENSHPHQHPADSPTSRKQRKKQEEIKEKEEVRSFGTLLITVQRAELAPALLHSPQTSAAD